MKVKNLIQILFLTLLLSACTSEKDMVYNPEVGDVYQIEKHDIDGHENVYQLVKVQSIDGETVSLMPNRMFYHEKVYCLAAGDYFSTKAAFETTKAELKRMYEDGIIVEAFRYYDNGCLGNDK